MICTCNNNITLPNIMMGITNSSFLVGNSYSCSVDTEGSYLVVAANGLISYCNEATFNVNFSF